MRRALATSVILLATGLARSALAQSDPAAVGRLALANQLGILEYCQSQGDVGDDAITAQKSVISRMPASPVSTDAAEALGKQGTMAAPSGSTMTLSSMASSHDTTVSALCKRLGSAATQSAAAQQNGMGAGGMPSMPKMPSMSGMPSMPKMPSMPSMPGAAPPQ